MKRSSLNMMVFCGFTLLGIVMMYPMPLDPAHLVVQLDGTFDCLFYLWEFWWTKESLIHLHASPFSTDFLFYPGGTSLVFSSLAFVHSLLSLPILVLSGDVRGAVLSYNLFIILSYGLSGLGMYLLVQYLGASKRGAFVAGLIFAFSSYHYWNLERLTIVCIELLPLYGYFFLKTIHGGRRRDALFCGLFLSLAFCSSLTYFVYLVMFSGMYSVYLLFVKSRPIAPGLLKRAAIAMGVFCLLAFPQAYAVYAEYMRSPRLVFPLASSIRASSDPTRVFFPDEYNPFHQKVLGREAIAGHPLVIPSAGTFLGFTAIALSTYAAIGPTRKVAAFWSVSALFFLVLSFGPYLKWNGHVLPVPLPDLLLRRWVPVLAISRSPHRYIAMVMMSISVLSGLTVSRLISQLGPGRLRAILVTGLIGVLVVTENWVPPVPFSPRPIPRIYHEIAQDAEDCIIVDVPFNLLLERETMYYQLVHGKRLLDGAVARPTSPSTYAMLSPLLRLFQFHPVFHPVFPSERALFEDPLRESTVQRDRATLRNWKVKYVIFHRKYLEESSVRFFEELLKEYGPVSIREDTENDIMIYRLY